MTLPCSVVHVHVVTLTAGHAAYVQGTYADTRASTVATTVTRRRVHAADTRTRTVATTVTRRVHAVSAPLNLHESIYTALVNRKCKLSLSKL